MTLDSILAKRPDPLDILKTTAYVVHNARSVRIREQAVEQAVDRLANLNIAPPAWDYDRHYFDGSVRTVNYLFLLDALNFCFWGDPRWNIEYKGETLDGYWALAASLKRAAEQDPAILEAAFLANTTPEELATILAGSGEIPLFADRWRNARELGIVLKNLWEGQAARLVECAERDAVRLVQMVVENFSSFDDVTVYNQNPVRIYKRAQIVVTDLWGAFRGKDWGEFENVDVLTAFADYKLPQILRAWGVLEYVPSLAEWVDSQTPLAKDGPEEVEIRAATLWAVEMLREAMAKRGRALKSLEMDWILWNASQGRVEGMKPYHRVRTIYY